MLLGVGATGWDVCSASCAFGGEAAASAPLFAGAAVCTAASLDCVFGSVADGVLLGVGATMHIVPSLDGGFGMAAAGALLTVGAAIAESFVCVFHATVGVLLGTGGSSCANSIAPAGLHGKPVWLLLASSGGLSA